MARPSPIAVAVMVAAVSAWPARLPAQQVAALRGSVVSAETGAPLPFALIRLEPSIERQFSDERGVFTILGIPAASYRLSVRQVGYQPFDSILAVEPGMAPLEIRLSRLVVQLAGLSVSGRHRCRAPGPPTPPARPELVRVFEQLSLNAQKHLLLIDRYPFYWQLERERTSRRRNGASTRELDTVVARSDHRFRYTPGRVIDDNPNSQLLDSYIVRYPNLADLADSLFQATHCFSLAGMDTLAGGPWIRLDFKVAETISDPDVDGSVYLDPESYQVRRIRITVTRVGRVVRGVRGFTAVAAYRELLPNLIIAEAVLAHTFLTAGAQRAAVVHRSEYKRLLQVSWVRRPGQDSVPPTP